MKNDTTKNKTTGTSNAQSALAEINAQIEALNQKRVALAQPLKDRYAEMRGELVALEQEIFFLDVTWKPEPMKPKAETKIADIITAKGQPMSVEEIIAALGNTLTTWKIKTVLKKKSSGAKAIFAVADGKYSLKATA